MLSNLAGRFRHAFWAASAEGWVGRSPKGVVGFSGNAMDRRYVFRLLLGADFEERPLGRLWVRALLPALRRAGCGLAFAALSRLRERLMSAPWVFRIPAWIRMDSDYDAYMLKKQRRIVEKQIANNGLAVEYRRDAAAFELFYHEMYAPHVARRFGDTGVVQPYRELKRLFDSHDAEIGFILKDGLAIAGKLIDYSEEPLRFVQIGVRGGSAEYLKLGALDAGHYFLMKRAAEKGRKTVNLGHCRPFLTDPIYQAKRHRGAVLRDAFYGPAGYWGLAVLDAPAAAALLAPHPFVSFEGASFYVNAIDAGGPVPPELEHVVGPHTRTRLVRFSPDGRRLEKLLFEG